MLHQANVREDDIQRLRRLLAATEQRTGLKNGAWLRKNETLTLSAGSPWKTGVPWIDACLALHGLSLAGVHEFYGAAHLDTMAASGYLLALLKLLYQSDYVSGSASPNTVLLCQTAGTQYEFGTIYSHGLQAFGFDTSNFLFVRTAKNSETLWAIEEGARSGCLLAVIGELGNVSFAESRRLLLASAATQTPVLLLCSQKGPGTSAARTRWCVRACAGGDAPFEPAAPHFARWQVELQRCRSGRLGQWDLEWDHETHCFRLAQDISTRLPQATDAPGSAPCEHAVRP